MAKYLEHVTHAAYHGKRAILPSTCFDVPLGKMTVGISDMASASSEDEFDQQIKRQRCVLGKENVDPKHSPLMHKPADISFNPSFVRPKTHLSLDN